MRTLGSTRAQRAQSIPPRLARSAGFLMTVPNEAAKVKINRVSAATRSPIA